MQQEQLLHRCNETQQNMNILIKLIHIK